MADKAKRKIMDMIEQGQISAEEGLQLIKAMDSTLKQTPDPAVDAVEGTMAVSDVPTYNDESTAPHIPEEEMQRMNRLKRWWFLPFGIGLLITTLGAIWMYMGYNNNGFGFGFWLAWLPFLLGILIVAVSFQTSRSVWLHVRVNQAPGETPQRIAISLPIPVVLTRWVFSNFGRKIPGLKDQPIEAYSEILENLSPESPFYVHVNDDDGDEVEVFIG